MGKVVRVSDSFTRVADALVYASGDHVASTVTAGSITAANSAFVLPGSMPLNRGGKIRQIILNSDDTDIANADFRVHFFTADPYATIPVSGDNIALQLAAVAADSYVGYADVSFTALFAAQATGVATPTSTSLLPLNIPENAGADLWGVLEARGAYIPASAEVLTIKVDVEPIA